MFAILVAMKFWQSMSEAAESSCEFRAEVSHAVSRLGDDYMMVGVSAERHRPDGTNAHIAIFDRVSYELVERVDLLIQEVYDLELISSDLVEGLRIGFQTNSLPTDEQRQLGLLQSVGVTDPPRLWAVGDALDSRDQAVTINAAIPTHAVCNSIFDVEVTLLNRGSALLVTAPPYPVYVSYKWLLADSTVCLDDHALRTRLLRSLAPGESRVVNVSIRPPCAIGTLRLANNARTRAGRVV